jgi:hypothetical protein
MRAVTDFDCGKMRAMKKYAQMNNSQIGKELGFSRTTVRKYVDYESAPSLVAVPRKVAPLSKVVKLRRKRVAELAGVISEFKRCKNLNTVRKTDRKFRIVKVIKYPSPQAVSKGLWELYDLDVSASTVRRDLRKMGWLLKARGKITDLTAAHRKTRYEFCKYVLTLSDDDLFKWIFSDEKWFNSCDHSSDYQWCSPDQQPLPKWKKQGAPSVMIWGGMCVGRREMVAFPSFKEMLETEEREAEELAAELKAAWKALPKQEKTKQLKAKADASKVESQRIAGIAERRARRGKPPVKAKKAKKAKVVVGLNKDRYERYALRPVMKTLLKNRTLMQDNAAPHIFGDELKALGIKEIPCAWPPLSPDLNPIENLWAILQRKVTERGPHSAKELAQYCLEELKKVEQSTTDGLCKSFRWRCQICVKRRGGKVRT